MRAHVEQQINLIAQNKAEKDAVVIHTLQQFKEKFEFFTSHIELMDSFFQATFSPLSASGGFSFIFVSPKDIDKIQEHYCGSFAPESQCHQRFTC